MTAREIYDLALRGGGNDFQTVTELLERLGESWCLIGGLAVNVYCEPIYTADADFVVIANQLDLVCAELAGLGFTISQHRFLVDAQLPGSGLVVQLTTDPHHRRRPNAKFLSLNRWRQPSEVLPRNWLPLNSFHHQFLRRR